MFTYCYCFVFEEKVYSFLFRKTLAVWTSRFRLYFALLSTSNLISEPKTNLKLCVKWTNMGELTVEPLTANISFKLRSYSTLVVYLIWQSSFISSVEHYRKNPAFSVSAIPDSFCRRRPSSSRRTE